VQNRTIVIDDQDHASLVLQRGRRLDARGQPRRVQPTERDERVDKNRCQEMVVGRPVGTNPTPSWILYLGANSPGTHA